MTVLSGDVIRALPNANAAEAAARIPGVSTERDEGEGKFVQIRGTEPRLSNVTVNGVHIPGTQSGSRITKLDDVPTDILGAIEVTKTLTADQDADAIGGSVNLVTKVPEGAPRGYIAGQFGQSTLESRGQSQGSAMWGGRFGEARKLGLLLGGTWDHNSRGINDIELAWDQNAKDVPIPVEWDQRDYLYDRTRWGGNAALDYRFDDGSTMFLRGAMQQVQELRRRLQIRHRGRRRLGAGVVGRDGHRHRRDAHAQHVEPHAARAAVQRQRRRQEAARRRLDVSYMANYSGTRSSTADANSSAFTYSGLNYRYDGTQPQLSDVLLSVERRPGHGDDARQLPVRVGVDRRRHDARRRGRRTARRAHALHARRRRRAAQVRREVSATKAATTRAHNRNFTAATPFPLTTGPRQLLRPELLQRAREGLRDRPAGESRRADSVRESESRHAQGDDEADQRLAEQLQRRREGGVAVRDEHVRPRAVPSQPGPPRRAHGGELQRQRGQHAGQRAGQGERNANRSPRHRHAGLHRSLPERADSLRDRRQQQPAIRRHARHRPRELLRPCAARLRAWSAPRARSSSATCPSAIRT